jgi:hypothetical protein
LFYDVSITGQTEFHGEGASDVPLDFDAGYEIL